MHSFNLWGHGLPGGLPGFHHHNYNYNNHNHNHNNHHHNYNNNHHNYNNNNNYKEPHEAQTAGQNKK